MSRLVIAGRTRSYQMNVMAFSSPMYGVMSSAQTKKSAVHFPMKLAQPEIQFDVQFSSQKDFEEFGRFVRLHQQVAQANTSLVTLSWPARDIHNWTGLIKLFKAGGQRFLYAPRARFVVELANSMVTTRTELASVAANWRSIYGGLGIFGQIDAVLRDPTISEALDILRDFGQNIFDAGRYPASGNPAPSGNVPVTPAPPGDGIVSGSGAGQ